MTREDLIKFKNSQMWIKARIGFCEEQIKSIGRLSSILSDMPKGSRIINDTEADSLSELLDQINELETEIKNSTIALEGKIKRQLEKLDPKYGLLLYNHYILGYSIKKIAREILHHELKYTYTLKDKALDEFDKYHEKKG